MVRGDSVVIAFCLFALLGLTAFGAWAHLNPPEPVIQEVVSEEGVAKAAMIKHLTGIEFPPEIAKWANVSFTGTAVSVDTDSLNIWLGKNWKEKVK